MRFPLWLDAERYRAVVFGVFDGIADPVLRIICSITLSVCAVQPLGICMEGEAHMIRLVAGDFSQTDALRAAEQPHPPAVH